MAGPLILGACVSLPPHDNPAPTVWGDMLKSSRAQVGLGSPELNIPDLPRPRSVTSLSLGFLSVAMK